MSGFNIRQGYHTVGLLWLNDKLVWYVDGVEVQRDEIRVPQTPHYMIISREMNSGAMTQAQAREGEDDLIMDGPYRPWDYGLYAFNVWRDRYKVNTDRAKIDYVRVWLVGNAGGVAQ